MSKQKTKKPLREFWILDFGASIFSTYDSPIAAELAVALDWRVCRLVHVVEVLPPQRKERKS